MGILDAIRLVVFMKFSHRCNVAMNIMAIAFGNLSTYGIYFLQGGVVCFHVNFRVLPPGGRCGRLLEKTEHLQVEHAILIGKPTCASHKAVLLVERL